MRRKVADAGTEKAAMLLKDDLDRMHPHASLSCGTCSESQRDAGDIGEDVVQSADEGSNGDELQDD